jgi:hypothetical protein
MVPESKSSSHQVKLAKEIPVTGISLEELFNAKIDPLLRTGAGRCFSLT